MDKSIEKFYMQGSERDRLNTHRLERDRTLRILQRSMPPVPAVVLDIGGAAGAYAFPLAKNGYEVHLIDPVSLHIEQAKEYAQKNKINLASYTIGDARGVNLPDNFADVILLFGPLYHLFAQADRLQTLQEAFRLLKPNGYLFATAIPRFASFIDSMNKGTIYSKLKIIEQDFTTGIHHKASQDIDFAYLHHPMELKDEILKSGFKNVSIVAIEGPVWHDGIVENLHQDLDGWEQLLALIDRIEMEEAIIGASAHIMALARKPA